MTMHRNYFSWQVVYRLRKKDNNEFGVISDIYILNIAVPVIFFLFAMFLCQLGETRN